MTSSPLKRLVVTPIVISAAAFSVLTLPLSILGSKPLTIQLQGEPVFYGKLRDVATPYLGLASAISLGIGIASVAITGWRSSAHKSSQVQAELSDLAQHLKDKEAQLEALKLSAQRLESSGLSPFLDESATTEPTKESVAAYLNAVPKLEPLVITTHPFEAQPPAPLPVTARSAAAKFSVTQNFLGYTQAKASRKPSIQENSPAPEDVEQLHTQLQQIMTQIASLQKTLSDTPLEVKSQEAVSSQTHVVIPASQRRLQVVKSWSVL
jgi:hypothetical protein